MIIDHETTNDFMRKKTEYGYGNDSRQVLSRDAAMALVRKHIPDFKPYEGWTRRFARWDQEGKLGMILKVMEQKESNPGLWTNWSAALDTYCDHPEKVR